MSSVLVKQLQLELLNFLYDYSVNLLNKKLFVQACLPYFQLAMILSGFCGKEFISLGRHTWRCKNKLNFTQTTQQNEVPNVEIRSQ